MTTIRCQQQNIFKIRDGIAGHGRQEVVSVCRGRVRLACGCSLPLNWLPRIECEVITGTALWNCLGIVSETASPLIQPASELAHLLHDGQTRVDGTPYIEHPKRVACMVAALRDEQPSVHITDAMIAAAWLHDVYEDTSLVPPALSERFGYAIGKLVEELTNQFTSEAYPKMNRARRKAAEIKRLAGVSRPAQIIKMCDRLDNLRTIRDKGPGFAMIYCDESEKLVEVFTASPRLQAVVRKCIQDVRDAK